MLYIIIIIASIIIALLRGGELEKLSTISIWGVPLFALALLLRVLIWIFSLLEFSALLSYSPLFIIISYLSKVEYYIQHILFHHLNYNDMIYQKYFPFLLFLNIYEQYVRLLHP